MTIDRHHRTYKEARDAMKRKWAKEQANCHINGCFINWTAKAGSPNSGELDHIIPVARGGSVMDRSNWAPACRTCNRSKSDKDLDAYRDLSSGKKFPPIRTTVIW